MNPFAKNAGAERNRRRDEKAARDRRSNIPQTRTPTGQSSNSKENDLAKKIAEAKKNLSPSATQSPVSRNQPVENIQSDLETKTESRANRESRLDELRRKSQANQANAKSIVKKEEPVVKPEVKAKIEPEVKPKIEVTIETPVAVVETNVSNTAPTAKNVFKQIQTVKKKQDHGSKRRKKADKKGGGRQKQVKKLNRQKYLEYKYEAKDLLSDEGVPEEHRSNVLGQIWAKGERMGIQEAIDFINQKELELILPEKVANDLRSLINRITTRR